MSQIIYLCCEKCFLKFDNKYELDQHLALVHGEEINVKKEPAIKVETFEELQNTEKEFEIKMVSKSEIFKVFDEFGFCAEDPLIIDRLYKLSMKYGVNETQLAWKYVKLIEVTLSPDPKNAYAKGHIKLVTNG